jgi:hypothetical protein
MFAAISKAEPTVIEQEQGRWQMRRGGWPYTANGVCIWGEAVRLDELVAAGANSVRTYDPAHAAWTLREAGRRGLSVMLGFEAGKPRHGFDYTDKARVLAQRERFEQFIRKYKDDPALLAWSVGNEIELSVDDDEAFARIMTEMNLLAGLARAIDPNHPVGISLAGIDQRKSDFVMNHCPNFQYVGINTYSSLVTLPGALEKMGFDRPYMVTEFGPHGHWEVPNTPWGAPVEPNSTQKARQYLKGHAALAADPRCVGSYAFYWGHKQEATSTWFGMFLEDGRRTGAVDAMTFAWTGKWPEHRVPQIRSLEFVGRPAPEFAPGATAEAVVTVEKGDVPLAFEWSIAGESNDRKLGGDAEKAPPVTRDGLRPADGGRVTITMPTAPGAYRLCVVVADERGGVATANLCFRVKDPAPAGR